ncbi:MAG: phosphatase PAP2 family protein [Bacteroidales bacterium]|nr:phosphatase PAP2 family protein [Bacteroidales bacterium]
MLDRILPYEQKLFFLINGNHHPVLDPVMWFLSNTILLIPLLLFVYILLKNKRDYGVWIPIFFAMTFVFLIGDLFSSTLIKPYVQRLRPTHYPGIEEYVHTVYNYAGKKYGFLSGHATNSFGFATFSSLLLRKRNYTWCIYIWAFLICYSRVYLGVHFISDIVAGTILGLTIGFFVYEIYRLYCIQIQKNRLMNGKKQMIDGIIILLFLMLIFTTLHTEGLL